MKNSNNENLLRDGRHYDLLNKRVIDDIPFYIRQVKKYGDPVLELACGTGRVTIPLAESGINITGIDISESMLSHAQAKTKEKEVAIEWIKGDCRDFKLNKKFNLIMFPFNTIAILQELKSIESCFSSVRNHLHDNGRFIIDFFNPRLDILTKDQNERDVIAKYPDPDGKGNILVAESHFYDAASQISRVKNYYMIGDQKEVAVDFNMRIFYPQELDALIRYNGFTIEAKYGNYDETPFVSESPKQLIVCCKSES